MSNDTLHRTNMIGIACASAAAVAFSFNDMAIKFLSTGYPLHQVVLIRSCIGMVLLLSIIVPLTGGLQVLRTSRLGMHLLRGFCVVFANMTFFLGLASLPLADAMAIFFVSPLVITSFSVLFLGETVGPRRWAAVGLGMVGVLIVMRPGSGAFQIASLMPLLAAVSYALLHIMTRKIGGTEKAVTMTFYILVVFIFTSSVIGLALGDGRFAGHAHPSVEFLLRAWIWPAREDLGVFLIVGIASTMGGYLISQAYRLCEAGLAAPFEYLALPMAIFWGVVVFGEWPILSSWIGIGLIMAGGLYMFLRETRSQNTLASQAPPKRR